MDPPVSDVISLRHFGFNLRHLLLLQAAIFVRNFGKKVVIVSVLLLFIFHRSCRVVTGKHCLLFERSAYIHLRECHVIVIVAVFLLFLMCISCILLHHRQHLYCILFLANYGVMLVSICICCDFSMQFSIQHANILTMYMYVYSNIYLQYS